MTADRIPPPPRSAKGKVQWIWDDVDQARRAWAITQACRLYSGLNVSQPGLESVADDILAYVTEQR